MTHMQFHMQAIINPKTLTNIIPLSPVFKKHISVQTILTQNSKMIN